MCTISRQQRQGQIMAPLPVERTTFGRPFATTGVDYAGPFDIKNFHGRGCRITKGYICLFICFVTKAVHLEPVGDLSTPAFLAAFSRFVSRRGCPRKMYSDNGRNFVGAARELDVNLKKVISQLGDEIVSRYGFQQVEWHFIPAAAPHMGGLWEAGVKSCKTHLKKVSGQIRHTFEEFATILSSIECCMNSRPLSPLSDNQDDIAALTPAHFLVGSSLLSPAQNEEIPTKTSLLNRWRKIKIIQQEFCRRWKSEYLAELNKRFRWKSPREKLALNDLVVLRNENVCPTDWRLGRIVQLHAGKDGQLGKGMPPHRLRRLHMVLVEINIVRIVDDDTNEDEADFKYSSCVFERIKSKTQSLRISLFCSMTYKANKENEFKGITFSTSDTKYY
ncbi:uncharacterized protein LOC142235840 [Haematobia irritans]|uniref:uncharacterized protein LOC142235840 n=1 Tax=Haematobia irritans TaxID=7368 RepID=UPI003F4F4B1F